LWPIRWPRPFNSAASLRKLAAVHNSGVIGSPRVAPSSRSFRSPSNVVSVATSGLRPPPARRTPPSGTAAAVSPRSSARSRPIVLRAIPVIFETAAIPPRSPRLGCRKQASTAFVQYRFQRFITQTYRHGINHAADSTPCVSPEESQKSRKARPFTIRFFINAP
jgi:hypothetical protein